MCFLTNRTFSKDRFRDFVVTLFNIIVQPAVVSVMYINDFSHDGQELWTKDGLIQSSNVEMVNYYLPS